MKDGIIRKSLKSIALLGYTVDLRITRLVLKAKGEPLYHLRGSCNKCGACCKSPMVPIFPPFFYLKPIRWIILTWHRLVNGFEYIDENPKSQMFIFRCTHWNSETKMCDSYDSRPGMCRDYPCNLVYSTNPIFLKECSYYAVDKNAERMKAALEDLNLPPEKTRNVETKTTCQRLG